MIDPKFSVDYPALVEGLSVMVPEAEAKSIATRLFGQLHYHQLYDGLKALPPGPTSDRAKEAVRRLFASGHNAGLRIEGDITSALLRTGSFKLADATTTARVLVAEGFITLDHLIDLSESTLQSMCIEKPGTVRMALRKELPSIMERHRREQADQSALSALLEG